MRFKRKARSSVQVRLEHAEAQILFSMAGELHDQLRSQRDDDVDRRLFPDAYEHIEDERAYRDLVGDDLRAHKLRCVARVQESVSGPGAVSVTLSEEDIEAWLTSLTDMRLAIGTRIAITEEKMQEELDPNHPDAGALAILHWLGWVQESMLEAVSR